MLRGYVCTLRECIIFKSHIYEEAVETYFALFVAVKFALEMLCITQRMRKSYLIKQNRLPHLTSHKKGLYVPFFFVISLVFSKKRAI